MRFDIPVQDAAAVRERHGVADGDEIPEQLAERKLPLPRVASSGVLPVVGLDHLVKRFAVDEPRRIERALVAISSECVDRHNAGMFETTRDLGLADEPGPAALMLRKLGPDRLERNHAIQLLISRDEDLAQSPLGVWLDDAEPTRALPPWPPFRGRIREPRFREDR